MPHYKLNNDVYWFDTPEEAAQYQPLAVEITYVEADAIRKANIPAPTAADVRTQRDALIAASDWTQARDIPDIIALAWQPYRQALRDITTQVGFPDVVTWPVAP